MTEPLLHFIPSAPRICPSLSLASHCGQLLRGEAVLLLGVNHRCVSVLLLRRRHIDLGWGVMAHRALIMI